MKIDELKEKLDNEFINNYDCVLINGTWGIGKSEYIKSYLNGKKYIYNSVFGINNMESLKSGVYFKLNALLAFLKKAIKSFSDKEFGISALTIPIPTIKMDLEKSIKKELKGKNIIIVFDDLERKSEKISMKELLGFIETISQINGIKVLLIASEDFFEDSDKEIFNKFKEKVINKTYVVDEYSSKAIVEITNHVLDDESIKSVIEKSDYLKIIYDFMQEHKCKNLRTLKKSIMFSKIILKALKNDNIILEDQKEIITVAFAIVYEMCDKLYMKNYSGKDFASCILQNYFKTNIFVSNRLGIIRTLIDIYNDKNTKERIEDIKEYYYAKHNVAEIGDKNIFFCSEDEIIKRINTFNEKSIKQRNENLSVTLWFKEFESVYEWSEKLGINNIFEEGKVMERINDFAKEVNVEKELYDNYDRMYLIEIRTIKDYYKQYINKLAQCYYLSIVNQINNKQYKVDLVDKLFQIIRSSEVDNCIKEKIVDDFKENEFYIPDINGDIDENIWRWCHLIWENISHSESNYNLRRELYSFSQERIKKSTIIGKYRLESLNRQYNIIE